MYDPGHPAPRPALTPTRPPDRVGSRNRLPGSGLVLLANLALLAAWGWLFRPVYAYLSILFTRQEFRTNQIVLLLVLALIVQQVRQQQLHFTPGKAPQVYLPGLALAVGGALAFTAAERWLDINTLSATLFGLASYGLLSLWIAPTRWRHGLPAALLLVGVLPFGEHMDTFIGFPVRLVTARMVGQGLAAFGVPNLGVDTILVFENGLSQVDNPCSGVKSLWTGSLFLLAATWIEHRPLNRRWILACAAFAVLLLCANLVRVAVLALAGPVAGWSILAETLHIPLGVIGFVAACAAAVWMLRRTGTWLPEPGEPVPVELPRPWFLAPALLLLLLGLASVSIADVRPPAETGLHWQFTDELGVQEWTLTPGEVDWLSERGAVPVTAARWRFHWRGLNGVLLFVASNTWRAHHRPERCFTVYGLEVQESRLHLAGSDFPLRWLHLGQAGQTRPQYTAGYWLQSAGRLTDDYAVRIWDDLAPQPQTWVLATVLFDPPIDPAAPEVQELFIILRQSIQLSLAGEK